VMHASRKGQAREKGAREKAFLTQGVAVMH